MSADLRDLFTELNDRYLWFDGDVAFKPPFIANAIQQYGSDVRYTSTMTPDVQEYNKYMQSPHRIAVKKECKDVFDFHWNIPDSYKTLDVASYLTDKLVGTTAGMSDSDFDDRAVRTAHELVIYRERHLFHILRTMIYVVTELDKHSVVWGVGRGSSVSSYILYLIGVHDVDSVEYDLNINDFLH